MSPLQGPELSTKREIPNAVQKATRTPVTILASTEGKTKTTTHATQEINSQNMRRKKCKELRSGKKSQE